MTTKPDTLFPDMLRPHFMCQQCHKISPINWFDGPPPFAFRVPEHEILMTLEDDEPETVDCCHCGFQADHRCAVEAFGMVIK